MRCHSILRTLDTVELLDNLCIITSYGLCKGEGMFLNISQGKP